MVSSKFNMNDRTALITGAAGLLGVQHAYALLECGASVVLVDLDKDKLEIAYSKLSKTFSKDKIYTKTLNLVNEDEIIKLSKELIEQDVLTNILINNAAIDFKIKENDQFNDNSRLENFTLDRWNLEVNVGLTSAFLCSKIFGFQMSESELGGVILNIASDLSVISPDQRLYKLDENSTKNHPVKPVTYSVIKSGLIGLTKYLSTYWPNKVRVNALSPGGIFNGQNQRFVKKIEALIPMGRMAKIDEYHAAIQFLCSDASEYMNGQNLIIDGGRTVW